MLVGRDAELGLLSRRISERRPVLVTGEAGIGKTTVLRAAARASGVRAFEGAGLATLKWRSYLPLNQALGREPLGADREAVAADLVASVDRGLLLLDDLHWADADTVALLPLIAGRIRLAASSRTDDPGASAVHAAAEDAGFELLELGPLSESDAQMMVRGRWAEISGDSVARIVHRARGNPFLLEELGWSGEPSETLLLALRARLGGAETSARTALSLLGLAGRPLPSQLLGAGGQNLVKAGLASEQDDLVSLRHALLGEVAVEDLSEDQRRRLHGRIARASNESGERARHLRLAGHRTSAHRAALEAVDQASTPGERADHLALAASTSGGRLTDGLRLRAVDALIEARRWSEASDLLDEFGDNDGGLIAEAALRRARIARGEGDMEAADRWSSAGLEVARGRNPEVEAHLLLEAVFVPLWRWDASESRRRARRAAKAARAAGLETARARLSLGWAEYIAGSRSCIRHLRAAHEQARASGDRVLNFEAAIALAVGLQLFSSVEAARQLLRSQVDRARRDGLLGWELRFRAVLAKLEVETLGDASAAIGELQELITEPGLGPDLDQYRGILITTLAHLGRDGEARSLLAQALPSVRTPAGRGALLWAAAEMAWASGRLEDALAVPTQARLEDVGPYFVGMSVLPAAWASFEADRRPPSPASIPESLHAEQHRRELAGIRALARGTPESLTAACENLAAAAEGWKARDPWLFGELRCLWGVGEAAVRLGDLGRARQQLLYVESRALAGGAIAILQRVRQSLRRAGVRMPRRAGTKSRLTTREQQILELVGQGCPTTEIARRLGIARSTVDTYVEAAVAKLGARTRQQAAAWQAQTARGGSAGARPPFIVVEGGVGAVARTAEVLAAEGWRPHSGWELEGDSWKVAWLKIICTGVVHDLAEASACVLAAARGAGIVAAVEGAPPLRQTLVEDLRHLGPLELRPSPALRPSLPADQRRLLDLLAQGRTLGEAAETMGMSRRTAARRLAAARAALGVANTAQALVAWQLGDGGGTHDALAHMTPLLIP